MSSQVPGMALANEELPALRCESPSPSTSPTPALGACPELSRCLSTTSSASHGSSTDIASRDSLGSLSSDGYSRQSSGSYQSRRSDVSFSSRDSTCSLDSRSRRRGFVRPQGTDFAASARSRESVLNLGSIAHIQYYFARTGLLDGKGAQLARKNKQQRATIDLSDLVPSSLTPKIVGTDVDSSYASMGSSPDLAAQSFGPGPILESPIEAHPMQHEDYFLDDYDESDASILPPTVSTYNHVEKPVPRPPTIVELKRELKSTLEAASTAINDVRSQAENNTQTDTTPAPPSTEGQPQQCTQGWYEVQGMHILDVMTLAIRAAKVYYTTHEHPDRLDAIKPEKEVRSDLLSVMEVLRHLATREFAGGPRPDELSKMAAWIASVSSMLAGEEALEAAERTERASWTWLDDAAWSGRETDRELAFMASMDPLAEPLPPFLPASTTEDLPTPFLASMQNGLRLIRLHNAAVKKSQRRFGAIGTFHTDTQKPYRCADNLRYWAKAAELRWEVFLKVDALGVVYNSGPGVWRDFEAAIFEWCRKVREEISGEVSA